MIDHAPTPPVRLSEAWDAALAFTRREGALLTPIALAFFGLPALLTLVAGGDFMRMTSPADAMRTFGLLLVSALAGLFGNLAVAGLALRPGTTVRDALSRAASRFGAGLRAALLLAIAFFVYLVVLSILLGLAIAGGVLAVPDPAQPTASLVLLMFLLVLIPAIALLVRLTTLWALVSDRPVLAREGIRAGFRQSSGLFWRLLLLWLMFSLSLQAVLLAINVGLGSLAKLGDLLIGPGVLEVLVAIVVAAVASVANGFWAVFAAMLYRAIDAQPASRAFE